MDRNDEHDRRRALLLAELMEWKFKGVDILESQNPRAIGIVTIARAIRELDEDMGFALAPPEFTVAELREVYVAALGYDVTATNLQRVLLRRGVLEPTGEQAPPGRSGGRPAALYRFASPELEVTDPFAVFRPPSVR